MNKIYISQLAYTETIEYFSGSNYQLNVIGRDKSSYNMAYAAELLKPAENVDFAISCHPDIMYCHLKDGKVYHGDQAQLGSVYPGDIIYNACSTGKYFIHNLKYTAVPLLKEVQSLGLIPINVSQGYTKCSIAVVSKKAIITYDKGIITSLRDYAPDVKILQIRPGHICLPGYDTGFIGGTCGKVGNSVVFNGDLSAHPDFSEIKDFIMSENLDCVWFETGQLTDIGSIIEEY